MSYKEIEELSVWNLPSTVSVPDGYALKRAPEPTKENMVVFMQKINELVQEVNYLRCRLTNGEGHKPNTPEMYRKEIQINICM